MKHKWHHNLADRAEGIGEYWTLNVGPLFLNVWRWERFQGSTDAPNVAVSADWSLCLESSSGDRLLNANCGADLPERSAKAWAVNTVKAWLGGLLCCG